MVMLLLLRIRACSYSRTQEIGGGGSGDVVGVGRDGGGGRGSVGGSNGGCGRGGCGGGGSGGGG